MAPPRLSQTSRQAVSRREIRYWAASIAVSGTLHLTIAALLLVDFGHSSKVPDAPAPSAMIVELASTASSPPQDVADAPPGPQQVEQAAQPQPQPKPVAFDPPPELPAPADALQTRPKEPEPQVRREVAAERTTAPPSTVAPPADTVKARVAAPSNASGSSEIQTWQGKLLAHLERHKRYPSSAMMRRQEDTVYVRFTIDRSGTVLRGSILRSHGYVALDQEVTALLRRASPVPRPPDTMAGATIEMVVPVEFYLQQRVAGR